MSRQARIDDDARLMSWENFRARFLDEGIAVDVPVAGDPRIVIFAESDARSVGLRTPVEFQEAPPTSIESIQVEVRNGMLAVQTSDPSLFQPFFAFLLDVSNRIQLDGKSAASAFSDALSSWRRMLAVSPTMADELQLGLAGELWVLERLLRVSGTPAIASWTGADREAHDFRLSGTELEVKTTTGERRQHIISRLDQLVASTGMNLYLLSIQLEGAGLAEGWSLGEQVAAIRRSLSADTESRDSFETKLIAWGWRDADEPRYPKRRRLRAPARIVPVDDYCPRLTPGLVSDALGPMSQRIRQVTYTVDVEGLGFEDGSPEFEAILPTRENSE